MFREEEWAASGLDATAFAARELKASLEGLAKHLFGEVECRWMDTYFPFTGGWWCNELSITAKGIHRWVVV